MKKIISLLLVLCLSPMVITAMAEENHPMTRAEMAEKVVAFYEEMEDTQVELTEGSALFADIEESPLKDAIQKCFSLGYMVGTSDSAFEPDGYVTRAQAAAIIDRMVTRLESDHKVEIIISYNNNKFTDDNLIPEWAKQSAYNMKNQYFIFGDENKNFNAEQIITKEQADSILERIKSLKIEDRDEYAKKAFENVFKFSLPKSAHIEKYNYKLRHDEELDDIEPNLYDPSFIAKISFEEDDLNCFLKEFYIDVQTKEDIKEINDILITHKALDNYIQNIKSTYPWWDLPDLSSLTYKNFYAKNGSIAKTLMNYIFIKEDINDKYYLFIKCSAA